MDWNVNNLSSKMKQRFCTDCNLPINVFQEPYFTDRLSLYNEYYNTLEKWKIFILELNKYKCEQDYFEDYNRVKDETINFIKSSEGYQCFLQEDMKQYEILYKDMPHKDIFHAANDGHTFISIDMKHANFSALHFYNSNIFGHAETWKDFISKFTNNKHIINSKYIRQVILGNCDSKRHIKYEKYLMDIVLSMLADSIYFDLDNVVFFSNDEIIVDVSDADNIEEKVSYIRSCLRHVTIPLKIECFKLHKINGTHGYYKEIFKENGTEIKFKCVDASYMPFVIRAFLNQDIQENDKVFYHNGLLAKFMEVPEIILN